MIKYSVKANNMKNISRLDLYRKVDRAVVDDDDDKNVIIIVQPRPSRVGCRPPPDASSRFCPVRLQSNWNIPFSDRQASG